MMNTKPKKSLCVIDEDDRTIGHIYSRRQALRMLAGTGGALLLAACGGADGGEEPVADLSAISNTNANLPSGCVVRPALTEGPIFVDNQANRSDIRTDPTNGNVSAGAPLALTFNLSTLANNACTPLEGAQIDIWQCDADGIYSDTNYENMGTVGQKFLRGHQFTDSNGACSFTTIYPGWYATRAVHIHFKVRTTDNHEFTSQVFFDPTLTDKVFANSAPYNARGARTIRNSDDGIYAESGDQMLLDVQESADGYAATFNVTLDMS